VLCLDQPTCPQSRHLYSARYWRTRIPPCPCWLEVSFRVRPVASRFVPIRPSPTKRPPQNTECREFVLHFAQRNVRGHPVPAFVPGISIFQTLVVCSSGANHRTMLHNSTGTASSRTYASICWQISSRLSQTQTSSSWSMTASGAPSPASTLCVQPSYQLVKHQTV